MPETNDVNAPLTDATDLALRLVEETARRQRAEALAETATATAQAETARATLVDLRATTIQSIAAVQAQDRERRMAAMHAGLQALRADLAGLRAAAEAALVRADPPTAPSVTPVAPEPVADHAAPVTPVAPEPVADHAAPVTPVDPEPVADHVPSTSTTRPARSAVGTLEPELIQSARELLTRGRLDVADDVIRGLEDAAARLRARSLPDGDD